MNACWTCWKTAKKPRCWPICRQGKQSGLLSQVQEVTTDMWDAYVEAAREAFGPQVVITIDRFHVMKNFQDCLTAARRELQRRLSGPGTGTTERQSLVVGHQSGTLNHGATASIAGLEAAVPGIGEIGGPARSVPSHL